MQSKALAKRQITLIERDHFTCRFQQLFNKINSVPTYTLFQGYPLAYCDCNRSKRREINRMNVSRFRSETYWSIFGAYFYYDEFRSSAAFCE